MQPDPGWTSGSCGNPQIDYIGRAERALMKPHVPVRPSWYCQGCGDDWPCVAAQVILTSEFTPHSLRVVMSVFTHEAARDLTTNRPDALYGRMLGWISDREDQRVTRAAGSAPVQGRPARNAARYPGNNPYG